MTEKTIRVLVVDDSAVIRELICDLLHDVPGVTVVGTACEGAEALTKAAELWPDIVTLDVQMPGMNGLDTLDALLAVHPRPVIMVSALTQRAADITFQLLDRGALDYVPKPDNLHTANGAFRAELIHKIRTMAGADVQRVLKVRHRRKQQRTHAPATPQLPDLKNNREGIESRYRDCCIAIGISTGGPPALSEIFETLEPPLPPIVVVQHMPESFTGPFARRLDANSKLSIKEAESGDILLPNHVFIARGGKHLRLRTRGRQVMVDLTEEKPESGFRPSVDVLMRDVARSFGTRSLGIIMTGMGHDGAAGCAAIRAAGGCVLGQDKETCDVYGMSKVAFESGHVDRQFALQDLPKIIVKQLPRLAPAPQTPRAAFPASGSSTPATAGNAT